MEEVWRDITLHHVFSPPLSNPTSSLSPIVFTDFLSSEPTPAASILAGDGPNGRPATALSLNSYPNSFSHENADGGRRAAAPFPFGVDRRAKEQSDGNTNVGDRRQMRMMKNRESASRSRARKQAYTNELQLEVANLSQENEKLKKQYEELKVVIETRTFTKKRLQRTSTAPF